MPILVNKIISDARLGVCNSCPSFKNNWCGKKLVPTKITCGCYMPMKVKLMYSKCPQGKW
jgi:hypothetical protein